MEDPLLTAGSADTATLRLYLDRWLQGHCPMELVVAWAQGEVDRQVLPHLDADDPESIPVEILLYLTSGQATHDDAARLLEFLDGQELPRRAWARWFASHRPSAEA